MNQLINNMCLGMNTSADHIQKAPNKGIIQLAVQNHIRFSWHLVKAMAKISIEQASCFCHDHIHLQCQLLSFLLQSLLVVFQTHLNVFCVNWKTKPSPIRASPRCHTEALQE